MQINPGAESPDRLGGETPPFQDKRVGDMILMDGVKLVECKLHPLQAALIKWGEVNRYGRITIIFQDGIPVKALVPTIDGAGVEMILFDKIARRAGLLK